jgi:F-type H+-transporting ATPase subunit epsilon
MKLFAELFSPEDVVFAGEVESVVLPGVEGDMTILPGHAPLTRHW